jgi:hypothetical protein
MARKKKIDSNKPTKIVKKRKVGRPKKRGRKKNYYTPKKKSKKVAKKGFSRNLTYNRVRAVLWANFKDDFPNYRAFISNQSDEEGNKIKGTSIVSQVFAQCKDLDCLDSDIIEIYNQFRNQVPDDENRPVLPPDYFDTHYYWELETQDWWSGFDSRVWVVAPMLIIDPDNFLGILGSDRYVDENGELLNRKFDARRGDYIIYGKSQRFKEFINHCNQMQSQGLIGGSSEVPNWRFVGQGDDEADVYWNPFTKRWEVRIVICEPNGDINNYDFDPQEPDRGFDEELIQAILNKPKPQEETQEATPTEETKAGLSKEEIKIRQKELEQEDKRLQQEDERIKLEKEKSQRENDRNERVNKLLQKYLDDKITTAEFERLLKLI